MTLPSTKPIFDCCDALALVEPLKDPYGLRIVVNSLIEASYTYLSELGDRGIFTPEELAEASKEDPDA